jgi:polar amino acid transport system permease protein
MHWNLDWHYLGTALPLYERALLLTLRVTVIATVLGTLLGAVNGGLQFYRVRFLGALGASYTALFRNTPLMIQLFFFFYALPRLGFKMTPETTAIVGLTLLAGAYMTEALKGGFTEVKRAQIEAGLALGMNRWQLMRHVILPQAWSYSIPAIGANVIFLLKETSIFSIVGVMDPMNVTKTQIGIFYRTNEALLLLVAAYAVVLIPLSLLLTWLERKVRHAEFGI